MARIARSARMMHPFGSEERKTMSQQAVERAIGKLVTDEAFRTAFVADPPRASLEAGLHLLATELDALTRIPTRALEQLAQDDRICRLPRAAQGGRRDESAG
jgi:hypothetical protein